MKEAIAVENIAKRFADVEAVNDISFTVDKGELFGFLGPNGAKEMFNMLRNRMGHQGSKKPIGTNASKERCPGAAGILGNIRE